MKKFFAWLLALVLVLGIAPTTVQAQGNNPFTDVQKSHFFYEAVLWAVDKGLVQGMTPTTFEPFTVCNRAQMVTFLWRAAGSPSVSATRSPFSDVKMGQWYTTPILWAVENGITEGMGDGTFGISRVCNRAQMVTFLWNAAGKPAPTSKHHGFTDIPAGVWYEAPVLWAVENGIITGATATTFNPNGSCQRAQMVTLLYRMQHPVEKASVVDAYRDTAFCYHIPKLVLSGDKASSFNKTMYSKLYGILENEELYWMRYTWGQKKNVVSIVVQAIEDGTEISNYYFFYASVADGKQTNAQALLDECGLSQQKFYQIAKTAMKAFLEDADSYLYERQKAKTLADSNVKLSQPYINSKGELCIVAHFYIDAGGGSDWQMINTVTGAQEPWLECNIHN